MTSWTFRASLQSTVSLFICLIILQTVPSYAQIPNQCRYLFANDDATVLSHAYDIFLNQPKVRKTHPINPYPELPKTLLFRGREYRVLAFLGEGVEGLVFKVENSRGERSIVKVFRHPHMIFSLEAIAYFRMSLKTGTVYVPIAMDKSTNSLKFSDMRAIPAKLLIEILKEIEASPELIERIEYLVSEGRKRADHKEQNQMFDIDRFRFVVVDPF